MSKVKTITVKNAYGVPDSTAQIITECRIDYIPVVSVIIPVYNAATYLSECIESVINQTLQEIEIICIDDGSVDNSLDILRNYAKKDNRITILSQKNLHAGIARNAGLSIARGEYVHFLDSDDFIRNDFYSCMTQAIRKYQTDLVYCSWGTILTDDEAERYTKDMYGNIKLIGKHLLNHQTKLQVNVEVWNKLFKLKLIKKKNIFFPNFRYGEDTSFTTQYLMNSQSVYGIEEDMHFYRFTSTGLMGRLKSEISSLDTLRSVIYSFKYMQQKTNLYNENIKFLLSRLESSLRHSANYHSDIQLAKQSIHLINTHILKHVEYKYIKHNKVLSCIRKHNYLSAIHLLLPEYKRISKISICRFFDLQKTYFRFGKVLWAKKNKEKKVPIKNTVNLVFILDKKYFQCTYVALMSLIRNKRPDTLYKIYIIHSDLTIKQQVFIDMLNCKSIIIKLIVANTHKYKDVKNIYHITKTALLKFDIPNILYDLDKVLYIDGDTFIQKDLSDIYNLNIDDYYIAATRELRAEKMGMHKIVGCQYYINSGVMLMNLNKMRQDKLPDKMIKLKQNQPAEWRCMDQDIFNSICDKKIFFMQIGANCVISIFIKEKWDIGYINDFYGTDYKTLSSMCQAAYILHFAGDIKPWTHKIQLNNLTKHYLDLVNNSLIHGFEKKHKRRQNLKPYIFFPYYLCAVIFMRYVLLPIKKYQNKHKR